MDQSPAATAQRLAVSKVALISAVRTGDTETVVDLLDRGVPIDTKDDEGESLLHWAAKRGHVTTMRLLISRGCDVDSVDGRGFTPLHWAAGMGETKAFQELIRMGATKSVVAGNFGTPLHRAAIHGHVETVEAMLVEGCPIDVVDNDGETVLHFIAARGHVEVVRKLVGRVCDVNAVKANGCTPLHSAAAHGRTEAVGELIKLGANKSVVAGNFGTPLHQAALAGHVETVEAMLAEGCPTDVVHSDGVTVLHSAAVGGHVEVFKVLVGRGCDVNAVKGGAITDRDTHSVSTLEQCFVGGHASKLSQFCEACGIRSNGEGLRGALATLITKGLVDAHKVLCLCAISGDSVFLEDQFSELVTSEACAMPAAIKSAKYYFGEGEGVTFLNQLGIPDDIALYPLQLSLLSLKCFEMGFAIGGIRNGTMDHTLFITKLLSHPVLKETVNGYFPNGLSPLDLARQFELHDIAALIEGAGGRPGVWANIPQNVFRRYSSELFVLYPLLIKVCDSSQDVKMAVIKRLGGQPVDSCLVEKQDGLWHPNAATVGADVGAERDDHEYKSLMEYIDDVSQPLSTLHGLHERVNKATYRKAINAMLNSPNGGSIHFGIRDDGIVEDGLYLDCKQNHAIDVLRKKVGDILNSFWPPVESSKAQVEPVNLRNDNNQLTGRWRFDIVVKPCKEGVKVDGHAYHRVGSQTVCMKEDQFAWRFMETASDSRKSRAKPGGRSHGQPLPHEERPRKEKSGSVSRQSHGKSRKGQKEPSQKHSKKKAMSRQ